MWRPRCAAAGGGLVAAPPGYTNSIGLVGSSGGLSCLWRHQVGIRWRPGQRNRHLGQTKAPTLGGLKRLFLIVRLIDLMVAPKQDKNKTNFMIGEMYVEVPRIASIWVRINAQMHSILGGLRKGFSGSSWPIEVKGWKVESESERVKVTWLVAGEGEFRTKWSEQHWK